MIQVLLLACSLSIDALGTGISYGIRGIKVPVAAKIIISLFAFAFTALALFVGEKLTDVLPSGIAKNIGIIILLCMGIWVIAGGLKGNEEQKNDEVAEERTLCSFIIKSFGITINIIKHPYLGDADNSKCIEPFEALYVGAALSIDSLGAGIAAATLGINTILTPFAVAITQFMFLSIGTFTGKKLAAFSKYSKLLIVISGMILIGLAGARVFV